MGDDIVLIPTGGQIVTGAAGVKNHFALAAEPARETLDAVIRLRPARTWLANKEGPDPHHNRLLLKTNGSVCELEEAEERLALIPDMAFLQRAAQLFDDAEHKPAPRAWYYLIIGAMLQGMTNSKNVAPDYAFQIVDILVNHEEVWGRYDPGFSMPVFVSALRKARTTTDFVPGVQTIVEACQEYRQRFQKLGHVVATLITVRENAEMYLKEENEAWGFDEPVEPASPEDAQRVRAAMLEECPDEDLPF